MKPEDKKLFAGTGRKLTPAEQKRKWELMTKLPNNAIKTNIDYMVDNRKFIKLSNELPKEHYE